jgi:hypothetical protein
MNEVIRDRDNAIYRLMKAKVDISKIAKYFGIGTERVRQIFNEYQCKLHRENPDILEIDIICRILGWRENERGKLQSTLHKNGYTAYNDAWRKLTYDDICAIPLLGPSQACIIWLAQNMEPITTISD